MPSYDDLVGGSSNEEEPVMDENERIALQEAEDERLARQLAQQGGDSAEVSVYVCVLILNTYRICVLVCITSSTCMVLHSSLF